MAISPTVTTEASLTPPSRTETGPTHNNKRQNKKGQNNSNNNNKNGLKKRSRPTSSSSSPKKNNQNHDGHLSDSSLSTGSSSNGNSNNKNNNNNNKNSSLNRRNTRRPKKNTNNHKRSSASKKAPEPSPMTVEEQEQYLAMDCEMVGVGQDGLRSALARVVLLNWHGQVVYDQYVQPDEPVTDYRTFVSGITPQDLEDEPSSSDDSNDTTTPRRQRRRVVDLATCRQEVLQLLEYQPPANPWSTPSLTTSGSGKIVVGHALKNDFVALGIRYPWYLTRDTAKWEPFMKTRDSYHDTNDTTMGSLLLWPRKLQELCTEKLHRSIQPIGQAHCPKEDALAALDLYKLVRTKWEKAMVYKINKTMQIQQQQSQQQQQQIIVQQQKPQQSVEPERLKPSSSSSESGDSETEPESESDDSHPSLPEAASQSSSDEDLEDDLEAEWDDHHRASCGDDDDDSSCGPDNHQQQHPATTKVVEIVVS